GPELDLNQRESGQLIQFLHGGYLAPRHDFPGVRQETATARSLGGVQAVLHLVLGQVGEGAVDGKQDRDEFRQPHEQALQALATPDPVRLAAGHRPLELLAAGDDPRHDGHDQPPPGNPSS
ncbi:MAG: hypothetical protein L7S64_10300, partial [Longimicrobiales bacterium]|nr:hypothetical protein [Longimicrobiales bacterium]